MNIKGEYRDVLRRNEVIIEERGWKPNSISGDLGKFLAALMKKDLKGTGIDYMAVGGSRTAVVGKNTGEDDFKIKLLDFVFKNTDPKKIKLYSREDEWVWAKPIENKKNIIYLKDQDPQDSITNKLKIDVIFNKNEEALSGTTLVFKEFALLGIDKKADGTFNTGSDGKVKMFLINYVAHEPISKKSSKADGTEVTRTVQLTFL